MREGLKRLIKLETRLTKLFLFLVYYIAQTFRAFARSEWLNLYVLIDEIRVKKFEKVERGFFDTAVCTPAQTLRAIVKPVHTAICTHYVCNCYTDSPYVPPAS